MELEYGMGERGCHCIYNVCVLFVDFFSTEFSAKKADLTVGDNIQSYAQE